MAESSISTSNPPAKFFNFNLKYLFYVGLWLNENLSPRYFGLYKIYEITFFIFSITFLFITSVGMFIHYSDAITFLVNVDKAIAAYNFSIKSFIFYSKRDAVKVLISEILHSGDVVNSKCKRRMVIHVVTVTVLLSVIIGLFQALALLKGEILADAWLPFDPKKNYWRMFAASQFLAVLFLPCLYRGIAIQGIVCSIVMYMCDQLIQLQVRLKALAYSTENEANLRQEFKDIIKKHIRLIRYSKSLKSVFKEYFLIQNFSVTAELCLNGLMASIVGFEQVNRLISFVLFLIAALFNGFIFCHLGNELMDQSEGIAMAAYESTWTSWPVDLQKDLLIMITMAQKSFTLSAGGISDMSMQTFAQALYDGYTVFAVLRDLID